MEMQFLAPKRMRPLHYSWKRSLVLERSGCEIPLKRLPVSDVLQKTLKDGFQDLVLCLDMGGHEKYVLIREIDDELARLCDSWKGFLLDRKESMAEEAIERIRTSLRRHYRANLQAVA